MDLAAILAGAAALFVAFAYYVRTDSDKNKALAQVNAESIAALRAEFSEAKAVLKTENKNLYDRLEIANERYEKLDDKHGRTQSQLDQFIGANETMAKQVSELSTGKEADKNRIADLEKQLRDQKTLYEGRITILENRVAVLEGQKAQLTADANVAQEGIDHPPAEAQEASEAK